MASLRELMAQTSGKNMFESYSYVVLAKKVFAHNPNIKTEKEVFDVSFELADKVERRTFKIDEDFKSDVIEAYFDLQKATQKTSTHQKLTVEALQTFIEMVKTDSLTESETEELKSSIETIFNSVLSESYDEEYDSEYDDEISDEEYYDDEEYSEDEEVPEYICTNSEEDEDGELVCGWSGSEEELSYNEDEEDGVCPVCGSAVELVSEEESEEEGDAVWDEEDSEEDEDYSEEYVSEATLHKTSPADKKASKMYKKSAAGKKSLKLNAKKRAKYATKISRCSETGKTFSFKTMSCVKPNKRR